MHKSHVKSFLDNKLEVSWYEAPNKTRMLDQPKNMFIQFQLVASFWFKQYEIKLGLCYQYVVEY